jgi:hypothetical protein
MTLLLGALNTSAIVLGADGAEFRHAPNQPKYLDATNRRKVLPVSGRSMAVGIHGQNRLMSPGDTLAKQWLLIDAIPTMIEEMNSATTVEALCRELFSCLTPIVMHTFAVLSAAQIQAAPIGLLVVGFDAGVLRPRCFEAWWPLHQAERSGVTEHPRDRKIPAVMHSGDGARFAQTAISHGGRYSVDRLSNADEKSTQEYVRTLYKKAESLQPSQAIEFTGEYHEVTVTPVTATWSINESPNKAVNPSGGSGVF